MRLPDANESEFEELTKERTVLAYFYAVWCPPCKVLLPFLEKVADTITGVSLIKTNVDESLVIAGKFNVTAVPTLILLHNGIECSRKLGVVKIDDIISWLNQPIT